MTRCLVTGASGFVGPHLVRALRDAGLDVCTTDRRGEPNRPQHHECDLTVSADVLALVGDLKPDAIVHLASISSVAQSFANPQEALHCNLQAACNVLEATRTHVPAARLLVIGSAEQYGNVDAAALPVGETQPFAPASPYAVSKVAQEYLALQYRYSYELDVVLTRSFNHSGPGQDDRFVLPSMARQIAEAETGRRDPVLQVGNLDVERDFLDVRDVAQAYVALLAKGRAGTPYNVCRGESFRLRDLVEQLVAQARLRVRLKTDPARLRPSDLPVLRGDPTRIREHTAWQPRTSISDTLRDILQDWRFRVGGETAIA